MQGPRQQDPGHPWVARHPAAEKAVWKGGQKAQKPIQSTLSYDNLARGAYCLEKLQNERWLLLRYYHSSSDHPGSRRGDRSTQVA